MQAAFYTEFGSPSVLQYGELDVPELGPDSVLVQVMSASVNPVDWKLLAGGLRSRMLSVFPVIPGWDLAGVVADIGPSVTRVHVGDEVWAYARMDFVHHGTFAEYTAVPERTLAPRPRSLSWSEAAAVPLAGLTAYQALVHRIGLTPSDRLLILGGAGGVGSFAIQIARAIGATVFATGSAQSHEYLASLGAIPVEHIGTATTSIDTHHVGAVLDLYGGTGLASVLTSAVPRNRIASIADASIVALGGHYVFVSPSPEDLGVLGRLAEEGKLRANIAQHFTLSDTSKAFTTSMEGHVRGKLVIDIGTHQAETHQA